MTEVVSIRFKNRGKAYYFDPAGLRIQVGDSVIVDTANGMEIAVCSRENHPVEDTAVVQHRHADGSAHGRTQPPARKDRF